MTRPAIWLPSISWSLNIARYLYGRLLTFSALNFDPNSNPNIFIRLSISAFSNTFFAGYFNAFINFPRSGKHAELLASHNRQASNSKGFRGISLCDDQSALFLVDSGGRVILVDFWHRTRNFCLLASCRFSASCPCTIAFSMTGDASIASLNFCSVPRST